MSMTAQEFLTADPDTLSPHELAVVSEAMLLNMAVPLCTSKIRDRVLSDGRHRDLRRLHAADRRHPPFIEIGKGSAFTASGDFFYPKTLD